MTISMDGIINIYKEKGFTSHDVVAKLRGMLKQKKIGHTGTLDPNAEGVLPICIGKATKVCDLITDKDKTYETVLQLGITTDTQDTTGCILSEKEVISSKQEICQVIASFQGNYMQTPPMYSAIKINGKRLYELAREGKEVERKARLVTIYENRIIEISKDCREIFMEVHCSKGTYIRTLCHDIGKRLGCGGCMKQLKRTKVGRFKAAESITLSELEQKIKAGTAEQLLLPIDAMFEYNKVILSEKNARFVSHGNPISIPFQGECILVYNEKNQFLAVYGYEKEKQVYKAIKMFL